ncbi:MAG: hypothetical protein Q9200_005036 [Gallowayella weberi]
MRQTLAQRAPWQLVVLLLGVVDVGVRVGVGVGVGVGVIERDEDVEVLVDPEDVEETEVVAVDGRGVLVDEGKLMVVVVSKVWVMLPLLDNKDMMEVVDPEPPAPTPPRLRHRSPLQPTVVAETTDGPDIGAKADWPPVEPGATLMLPLKLAEARVLTATVFVVDGEFPPPRPSERHRRPVQAVVWDDATVTNVVGPDTEGAVNVPTDTLTQANPVQELLPEATALVAVVTVLVVGGVFSPPRPSERHKRPVQAVAWEAAIVISVEGTDKAVVPERVGTLILLDKETGMMLTPGLVPSVGGVGTPVVEADGVGSRLPNPRDTHSGPEQEGGRETEAEAAKPNDRLIEALTQSRFEHPKGRDVAAGLIDVRAPSEGKDVINVPGTIFVLESEFKETLTQRRSEHPKGRVGFMGTTDVGVSKDGKDVNREPGAIPVFNRELRGRFVIVGMANVGVPSIELGRIAVFNRELRGRFVIVGMANVGVPSIELGRTPVFSRELRGRFVIVGRANVGVPSIELGSIPVFNKELRGRFVIVGMSNVGVPSIELGRIPVFIRELRGRFVIVGIASVGVPKIGRDAGKEPGRIPVFSKELSGRFVIVGMSNVGVPRTGRDAGKEPGTWELRGRFVIVGIANVGVPRMGRDAVKEPGTIPVSRELRGRFVIVGIANVGVPSMGRDAVNGSGRIPVFNKELKGPGTMPVNRELRGRFVIVGMFNVGIAVKEPGTIPVNRELRGRFVIVGTANVGVCMGKDTGREPKGRLTGRSVIVGIANVGVPSIGRDAVKEPGTIPVNRELRGRFVIVGTANVGVCMGNDAVREPKETLTQLRSKHPKGKDAVREPKETLTQLRSKHPKGKFVVMAPGTVTSDERVGSRFVGTRLEGRFKTELDKGPNEMTPVGTAPGIVASDERVGSRFVGSRLEGRFKGVLDKGPNETIPDVNWPRVPSDVGRQLLPRHMLEQAGPTQGMEDGMGLEVAREIPDPVKGNVRTADVGSGSSSVLEDTGMTEMVDERVGVTIVFVIAGVESPLRNVTLAHSVPEHEDVGVGGTVVVVLELVNVIPLAPDGHPGPEHRDTQVAPLHETVADRKALVLEELAVTKELPNVNGEDDDMDAVEEVEGFPLAELCDVGRSEVTGNVVEAGLDEAAELPELGGFDDAYEDEICPLREEEEEEVRVIVWVQG